MSVKNVPADERTRPTVVRRNGRRAERRRKLAVISADVLAVALALAVASMLDHSFSTGPTRARALVSLLSLPLWILSLTHYRLYTCQSTYRRPEELGRILHASGAAALGTVFLSFMFRLHIGRSWALLGFVVGALALLLEREVVRRVFRARRRKGRLLRPVVLVGANVEAAALVTMLTNDASLGYRVVAIVADDEPVGSTMCDIPIAGRIDDVLEITRAVGASGVVIAATAVDMVTSNRLARTLTDASIHVEISSSLLDIAPERLRVQPLGRFPVVYVQPVRYDGWRALAKRAFDVAVSAFGLMAAAPAMAAVALAVKLDSRGPVLFRQIRVGRDGREFEVLKFRSMVVDAEERLAQLLAQNEADGPLFKIRQDPRVTRVGRVIRKLSLDELPQLWNVLMGHMSLVGPRPALPREVGSWHPELHQRLRVKPGITGMWQVSGRSDLSFDDYARLDLYYVDNWSLWTDLAIVAKTIPTVLLRRGGY